MNNVLLTSAGLTEPMFAHSESDAPGGEILHDEAISLSNRQAILVSGERKMVIE